MKQIARILAGSLFVAFFYQYGFMNNGVISGVDSPSFGTLTLCNNSRNVLNNELTSRGISTSSFWMTGCVEVN
jgi:hypothetical protein